MASHVFLETSGQSFVFEGGDVISRTSTKPSGIFVVHKDVLSSCSEYFSALFSQRWEQRPHCTLRGDLGGDEAKMHVYEFDLYFDMETKLSLLKKKVSSCPREGI